MSATLCRHFSNAVVGGGVVLSEESEGYGCSEEEEVEVEESCMELVGLLSHFFGSGPVL
jgi:hypothetical protein